MKALENSEPETSFSEFDNYWNPVYFIQAVIYQRLTAETMALVLYENMNIQFFLNKFEFS